jgi:hypothetical protein
MKRLCTFTAWQRSAAWLLRDRLQQEGIAVLLRNEELFAAMGEIPFVELRPELWVIDDEILPRAQYLLAAWQQEADPGADWACPGCGERIEGQFCVCWQCGRERED